MRMRMKTIRYIIALLLSCAIVLLLLELGARWKLHDIKMHAEERVCSQVAKGIEADEAAVKEQVRDYEAFVKTRDDSAWKTFCALSRDG